MAGRVYTRVVPMFTMKMTDEEHAALKAAADASGLGMAGLVRSALAHWAGSSVADRGGVVATPAQGAVSPPHPKPARNVSPSPAAGHTHKAGPMLSGGIHPCNAERAMGGDHMTSHGRRAAAPELISTREVAQELGLSYRIVDYWCRASSILAPTVGAHGSGSARGYTEDDLERLRKAACLSRALGSANRVTIEFLERFVVEATEIVGGWAWTTKAFQLTVHCE